MPPLSREELERKFPPTDDPIRLENRRQLIWLLLATTPQLKQELLAEGRLKGLLEARLEGRLIQARASVRQVLSSRGLTLSPAEEDQIEACADLVTLVRWHEQAISATTVAEALRTQAGPGARPSADPV
ncbi:hypothetical protein [Chondromyces crocatus]|nr:hypothetical protein [Chondromyces crocatus]